MNLNRRVVSAAAGSAAVAVVGIAVLLGTQPHQFAQQRSNGTTSFTVAQDSTAALTDASNSAAAIAGDPATTNASTSMSSSVDVAPPANAAPPQVPHVPATSVAPRSVAPADDSQDCTALANGYECYPLDSPCASPGEKAYTTDDQELICAATGSGLEWVLDVSVDGLPPGQAPPTPVSAPPSSPAPDTSPPSSSDPPPPAPASS